MLTVPQSGGQADCSRLRKPSMLPPASACSLQNVSAEPGQRHCRAVGTVDCQHGPRTRTELARQALQLLSRCLQQSVGHVPVARLHVICPLLGHRTKLLQRFRVLSACCAQLCFSIMFLLTAGHLELPTTWKEQRPELPVQDPARNRICKGASRRVAVDPSPNPSSTKTTCFARQACAPRTTKASFKSSEFCSTSGWQFLFWRLKR